MRPYPAMILMSLLMVGACARQVTDPNLSEPVPADYFPNDVGRRWIYLVTDSRQPIIDTAVVEITSYGRLGDQQSGVDFSTWRVRTGARTDSFLVRNDGRVAQSIRMPRGQYDGAFFGRIELPLTPGRSWEWGLGRDIVGPPAFMIVSPTGHRVDVRTVRGEFATGGVSTTFYHELSIVPGLGIVEMKWGTVEEGPDEVWRLIDPPPDRWPGR